MKKVSILCTVLCAGLLAGGCSLSDRKEYDASSESNESVVDSFLGSVGGYIVDGESGDSYDEFYDFSDDGSALTVTTLSYVIYTNGLSTTNTGKVKSVLDEDSLVVNAGGGYTAKYYPQGDAVYAYIEVTVSAAGKVSLVFVKEEDAVKED